MKLTYALSEKATFGVVYDIDNSIPRNWGLKRLCDHSVVHANILFKKIRLYFSNKIKEFK